MSPKARRIVQVAYIAFVLIGVAVYKTFTGEIQAQLLAPGGIDGSVNWTQHVTIALMLATALSIAIFFSIPASPLFYIAFGYFHGPFAGTLIAALATTAGSVGAYCFFREAMPRSYGLKGVAVKNVFATLLLLRSSPWFPNPLITLFCSAFDVGIATFTATTFLGTMPLIAVYALAASRLHGHLDVSVLYSTEVAVALGLLSAISLLGLAQPLRTVRESLKAKILNPAVGVETAGERP